MGGGVGVARPPPFNTFTITYKVALYEYAAADSAAEMAYTLYRTLPLFNLYPYVLYGDD